jgi:hypothetical protein
MYKIIKFKCVKYNDIRLKNKHVITNILQDIITVI